MAESKKEEAMFRITGHRFTYLGVFFASDSELEQLRSLEGS
jgi:hypothetical protein